jgi:hypothetical protein
MIKIPSIIIVGILCISMVCILSPQLKAYVGRARAESTENAPDPTKLATLTWTVAGAWGPGTVTSAKIFLCVAPPPDTDYLPPEQIIGQTIQWTDGETGFHDFNSLNEPNFNNVAAFLTNGENDWLSLSWRAGVGGTKWDKEAAWFGKDPQNPDFAGYDIAFIRLVVYSISIYPQVWEDGTTMGTEFIASWAWEIWGVASHPDFEISVSPTTPILVHVGGSTLASLTIKSIDGFSGSIQLSSSSPSEAKTKIIFAQNPVDLSSGSEVTVSMHIASYFDSTDSRFGALGEYKFALTGTDGSTGHDVEITIELIANTVAINNLVYLQQIPKNDPTFSAQQNFLIAASNGSVLYWAQNIVCVRPNPSLGSGSRIWSTFQAFTEDTNFQLPPSQAIAWPYMGILAMYIGSKIVSFPTVLNLTSYIDGNDLVLTNNASSRLNTVRLTLPDGSYIVGYNDKYEHQFTGKTYGFDHASPEIAIAGTPILIGSSTADFKVGTKGSVECSVKLFGESDWSLTLTRFMYADSNRPQTAERSLHLAWNPGNTFNYDKTIKDPSTAPQGISYSPVYP